MGSKLKSNWEKNHEKICSLILFLILIGAFLYNCWVILKNMNPYYINSDLVNEITYRQRCYEQRTLVPRDFVCSTELFASRPILVYCLFYKITRDFLLSYQLEVICMLAVMLLTMWFLCKTLGLRTNNILIALCIFLVWMPYYIKNVLWLPHDAYSLFAIAVFLTLSFRIRWFQGKNKRFSLLCCILIAALTGLVTMRMIVALYVPLLLIDLIVLWLKYRELGIIDKSDKQAIMFSSVLFVVNMIFYVICMTLFGEHLNAAAISFAKSMDMLSMQNISNQINTVLMCFGIVTDGGSIASATVILFVLYILVFILIITVLYLLIRKYHATSGYEFKLISFALMVLNIDFCLYTATGLRAPRYYFSAIILIPILISMWLNTLEKKRYISVIVAGGLLLLNIAVEAEQQDRFLITDLSLKEVAQYVDEREYQYVAASYWNAAVIKGYLNGKVECAHSQLDGIETMSPFSWLIDTSIFQEEKKGETFALILTEYEYTNITESFMRIMLDKYSFENVKVGRYYIYGFTENPYTLISKVREKHNSGLPEVGQDYKIVYPDSSDLAIENAVLDENNVLVSDGKTSGYMLFGPGNDSEQGKYDITLNYSVEYLNGSDVEGNIIFDIALDSEQICGVVCDVDKTSETLTGIDIEEGHNFEARVYVPKGIRVNVYSIEYKRVR